MPSPRVLAMVLAGGEGSRLYPLTADRSKPAVPFAGRYRIVDFVLSNLINSGMRSIYLLVQYKSQSLIEHVHRAWTLPATIPDQFVTIVPPQMREGPEWFQGTVDAVFQNRNLITSRQPRLVAVFGADHVYRMDVRQMVRCHLERRAQVTVAALPVPLAAAPQFGVIGSEADGRITSFEEKPSQPVAMPGQPDLAYASMGNYLFDVDVLLEALAPARERGEHDFGRHLLPRLMRERRVFAYDFARNEVPGVRADEEPAYWRDVGTVDAYFAASMDTLGVSPRFDLFNPAWPIGSSAYQGPTARIGRARLDNVSVGAGTVIAGGSIRDSILRRGVRVEPEADIDSCVIMDHATIGRGAHLRRVIVDRYNEIPPGTRIGFDRGEDSARFDVTESGLVVIKKRAYAGATARY